MVVFGVTITVVLFVSGILFGKNRLIYTFEMFWMWILMAFNIGGSDYAVNETIFTYVGTMKNDITVYQYGVNYILARWCHQNNLDFRVYTILTMTVAVIIIYYIVKEHCDYPAAAISLFYIYPMFDSVIQDRFFVAMVICLLAFHFWSKRKMIIYYILIVIAAGFHSSIAIYFIFPLIVKIITGKRKWLIVPLVGTTFVLFHNGGMLSLILGSAFEAKFTAYSGTSNYSTIFIQCVFVLMEVLAIVSIYKSIPERYKDDKSNELLAQWNLASFSFIPFLITNSIYLRWYRLINIYNYMYAANSIHIIQNHKLVRYNLILLYLIVIMIFGIMSFFSVDTIDSVFKYNSFLQWLFN